LKEKKAPDQTPGEKKKKGGGRVTISAVTGISKVWGETGAGRGIANSDRETMRKWKRKPQEEDASAVKRVKSAAKDRKSRAAHFYGRICTVLACIERPSTGNVPRAYVGRKKCRTINGAPGVLRATDTVESRLPLADVCVAHVASYLFLSEACQLALTCVAHHLVARPFVTRARIRCMPHIDLFCVDSGTIEKQNPDLSGRNPIGTVVASDDRDAGAVFIQRNPTSQPRCNHTFTNTHGPGTGTFGGSRELRELHRDILAGKRPPSDGASVCGCVGVPFVPIFSPGVNRDWLLTYSNGNHNCECLTQQPHGLAPKDRTRGVYCYSMSYGNTQVRTVPRSGTPDQIFVRILEILRRNMIEGGLLVAHETNVAPKRKTDAKETKSASRPHEEARPFNTEGKPEFARVPRIVNYPGFRSWMQRTGLAHGIFEQCRWMLPSSSLS
jgi:hypothetical protein